MPTNTSTATSPTSAPSSTRLSTRGSRSSRCSTPDEDARLQPGRVACLFAEVGAGLRKIAERRLHLVERPRHDGPEQRSDQREQADVVQQDPDGAGDAAAPERLDARAHRRRDDERQEEEREDQLELPEREREHDDGADDDRRRRKPGERFASSLRCWPRAGNKKPLQKDAGPMRQPDEQHLLGVAARTRSSSHGRFARGFTLGLGGFVCFVLGVAGDARRRPPLIALGALGARSLRLAVGAHAGRPHDREAVRRPRHPAAARGGDPARPGRHHRGRAEPARARARLRDARRRRARGPVRAAAAPGSLVAPLRPDLSCWSRRA